MTCFRPRTVFLGVRTMGDVTGEKYSPKTPQKGAWIGRFKPKRQNLYIAISPELLIGRSSDLRTEFRPRKTLRGWSAITLKQIQHGWRPLSWKSIWRDISAAGVPIWTKFGSLMQNDTPITAKWARSKPEVEFAAKPHTVLLLANVVHARPSLQSLRYSLQSDVLPWCYFLYNSLQSVLGNSPIVHSCCLQHRLVFLKCQYQEKRSLQWFHYCLQNDYPLRINGYYKSNFLSAEIYVMTFN